MTVRWSTILCAVVWAGVSFNGHDAINHWVATKEGTIQAHIESPYYLRRPSDLSAFLQQTDYLHLIAMLNAKLLLIKTELIKKMEQSNAYTIDFMYQTECIINYFLQESDLYSTLKSPRYMNAIFYKQIIELDIIDRDRFRNVQPLCPDVPFALGNLEHLEGMANRSRLDMKPEHTLSETQMARISPSPLIEIIMNGMRKEPQSWRYPLFASYYWRMIGNAAQAMLCARRALHLSTRESRDKALLSVGSILQRCNRTADAHVVLLAARDHQPGCAENQMAAAGAYFLAAEFNRSLEAMQAVRVNDVEALYGERCAHIRKSLTCFRFIKTKLRQIERQLADMRDDLDAFVLEKRQLKEYYDKLLDEQVPISQRLADDRTFDNYSHQMLHRSQYCAMRRGAGDGDEPVLSCDFYSELQLQLNKDTTIDTIQNYIDTKMDFIRNQWELSLGVYKHLNVEAYTGDAGRANVLDVVVGAGGRDGRLKTGRNKV